PQVPNVQVRAVKRLAAPSLIPLVRFTRKLPPAGRFAFGLSVAVRPSALSVTAAWTRRPLATFVSWNVLLATFVTRSLKTTTTLAPTATPDAPGPGLRLDTVGAVVSATVRKVHVTFAARALFDRSRIPVVSVAV